MNYKDLAERVGATFVQAAVGAMGTNTFLDLGIDQWKMIVMAGVSAALSVLKGAAAARLAGTKGTASLVD